MKRNVRLVAASPDRGARPGRLREQQREQERRAAPTRRPRRSRRRRRRRPRRARSDTLQLVDTSLGKVIAGADGKVLYLYKPDGTAEVSTVPAGHPRRVAAGGGEDRADRRRPASTRAR